MFPVTLEEFLKLNKLPAAHQALLISQVPTIQAKRLESAWWALLKTLLKAPA